MLAIITTGSAECLCSGWSSALSGETAIGFGKDTKRNFKLMSLDYLAGWYDIIGKAPVTAACRDFLARLEAGHPPELASRSPLIRGRWAMQGLMVAGVASAEV